MEHPASRLLALLALLQARPVASGQDLADQLGVTERSVRRYVRRLQDLGIPVDGERGPYGGYRLRPGYRLPPLMLTSEEAVAVTIGLVAARRHGVGTGAPAMATALAKLERVLPDDVRERVLALQETLGFVAASRSGADVDHAVLTGLSIAAVRCRRVRLSYRDRDGADSEREVDPYGIVFHAGRWYLVGHDHLRDAERVFRLDRVVSVEATGVRFSPPEGFDAPAHLARSLATLPTGWQVEVLLHTDLATATQRVPTTIATLEERDGGILLRTWADPLEWMARFLVGLALPFTVRAPDELRSALAALAREVAGLAEGRSPSRPAAGDGG